MNEQKNKPDDRMVECPVCGGKGEFRGSETLIKWFECAYCEGTGGVTEKQYYAWYDRSARFAVSGLEEQRGEKSATIEPEQSQPVAADRAQQ